MAAAPPRRAEKSRRFTGHLHSRIAHGLEADREFLQFTSGGVGRGRGIQKGRKRRDAATLVVHKTVVYEQSPLARDPQELRHPPRPYVEREVGNIPSRNHISSIPAYLLSDIRR